MTDAHAEHDVVPPRQAVVEVLLAEQLGGAPQRDLTAAVATAFARDGGAAAVARVPSAQPAVARPRAWLAAALVLLGLSVLFAVAWSQTRGDRNTAQDPEPAEGEVLPVHDLEQLRQLLPKVVRVELEVLRLADPDLPGIDIGGVPVTAPADVLRAFVAALATDASMQPPAGWEWQNRLSLVLSTGQRIEMAVEAYDGGARQTLGLRGLQGDFDIGGAGVTAVRELLATAMRMARLAHGVVTSAADLTGVDAFPGSLEELRLFRVAGADLAALSRFPRLRRLDASGLHATLGSEGLGHIGACATLEELSLAGAAFSDLDVVHFRRLVHLRQLDLRGVRGFTGEGFEHLSRSSRMRDGPVEVDLRDVPTLTDAGLLAIVESGVSELLLGGSGGQIGASGWQALLGPRELRRLDLSRWSLDAHRLAALAARTDLQELVLDDCALDDAAMMALAQTKSPLRKLSLRRVQGITLAGYTAICELATLREIDLTGTEGLELDEMSKLAFFHTEIRFVR